LSCRLCGALVVEGEEAGEDFLVGEGLTIQFQGPAVGGEDGLVEGAVGRGEPVDGRCRATGLRFPFRPTWIRPVSPVFGSGDSTEDGGSASLWSG